MGEKKCNLRRAVVVVDVKIVVIANAVYFHLRTFSARLTVKITSRISELRNNQILTVIAEKLAISGES